MYKIKMYSVIKWKLWKFIIALTTFHCAYAQKAELSNVDNIIYPRSYICLKKGFFSLIEAWI